MRAFYSELGCDAGAERLGHVEMDSKRPPTQILEIRFARQPETILEIRQARCNELICINHVGFGVPSIVDPARMLSERGIPVTTVKNRLTGRMLANFRDLDGARFQLAELGRDGAAPSNPP